jgi:hypothetical protein
VGGTRTCHSGWCIILGRSVLFLLLSPSLFPSSWACCGGSCGCHHHCHGGCDSPGHHVVWPGLCPCCHFMVISSHTPPPYKLSPTAVVVSAGLCQLSCSCCPGLVDLHYCCLLPHHWSLSSHPHCCLPPVLVFSSGFLGMATLPFCHCKQLLMAVGCWWPSTLCWPTLSLSCCPYHWQWSCFIIVLIDYPSCEQTLTAVACVWVCCLGAVSW